jgi:hypothetical protein
LIIEENIMNPLTMIPLLLQYAPGVVSWVIAEEPTISGFVTEAEALISQLTGSGTPAPTAQATGGLALIGQLLAHAASTFPAATTTTAAPAVTK